MAGKFTRITLKGHRSTRELSLMLSVVGLVEQDHGPLGEDGWKLLGVRVGGETFSARITKRSIVIQPNVT
ncbi:MAG: hypothetical protein P4M09_22915 [Devosia sp.]|nr:hypothetical protein [Devosia sp.]